MGHLVAISKFRCHFRCKSASAMNVDRQGVFSQKRRVSRFLLQLSNLQDRTVPQLHVSFNFVTLSSKFTKIQLFEVQALLCLRRSSNRQSLDAGTDQRCWATFPGKRSAIGPVVTEIEQLEVDYLHPVVTSGSLKIEQRRRYGIQRHAVSQPDSWAAGASGKPSRVSIA